MNAHTGSQPLPLDAIAWYAWESGEPESNWLLTYVDMLSVVLAMLVVLLGHLAAQQLQTPQPDATPVAVEQPREIESVPSAALSEVQQPSPLQTEPEVQIEPESEAVPSPEERLASAIESQFQGEIKVVPRDQGVSLEIADVILFASGKADLLAEAEPVLSRLVETLQATGEADVAVEGHTDDRPILGGRFHSNWELAAARANAVTRYLLSQGFAPNRLRSVSFADTQPVADNATEAGRAENRRVNLRVEFL
ncbi:MAG: OmpA family protein [Candidatus Thiodiazotropha sp.]